MTTVEQSLANPDIRKMLDKSAKIVKDALDKHGPDITISVKGHTRRKNKPFGGYHNDKSREVIIIKTDTKRIRIPLWEKTIAPK